MSADVADTSENGAAEDTDPDDANDIDEEVDICTMARGFVPPRRIETGLTGLSIDTDNQCRAAPRVMVDFAEATGWPLPIEGIEDALASLQPIGTPGADGFFERELEPGHYLCCREDGVPGHPTCAGFALEAGQVVTCTQETNLGHYLIVTTEAGERLDTETYVAPSDARCEQITRYQRPEAITQGVTGTAVSATDAGLYYGGELRGPCQWASGSLEFEDQQTDEVVVATVQDGHFELALEVGAYRVCANSLCGEAVPEECYQFDVEANEVTTVNLGFSDEDCQITVIAQDRSLLSPEEE